VCTSPRRIGIGPGAQQQRTAQHRNIGSCSTLGSGTKYAPVTMKPCRNPAPHTDAWEPAGGVGRHDETGAVASKCM